MEIKECKSTSFIYEEVRNLLKQIILNTKTSYKNEILLGKYCNKIYEKIPIIPVKIFFIFKLDNFYYNDILYIEFYSDRILKEYTGVTL